MFADNIIWDIDLEPGEKYEDVRADLALPKRVELPKGLWLEDGDPVSPCYDDEISDWLSNEYGYCVKGFVVV